MLKYTFFSFLNGSFDIDPATGEHKTPFLHVGTSEVGSRKTLRCDADYLMDHPEIDVVTVTGLDQSSFERFITAYGKQLRAIRFFKNKTIEDWSILGMLPDLEYVDFYQNHRLTHFWDMSGNKALTGLSIRDFTRFASVEGITSAPALKHLCIGDTTFGKMVLPTLAPLAGSRLESFSYNGKKLIDRDLSFLFEMPDLRVYNFPSNLYSTAEVAWIAANFPHLTGMSIRPYIEFTQKNLTGENAVTDFGQVVGSRKPLLTFGDNEERLRAYAAVFEELKTRYQGMTYAEAFKTEPDKKRGSRLKNARRRLAAGTRKVRRAKTPKRSKTQKKQQKKQ